MITEGLNVAKVISTSGKTVEMITTDDDGQFSTWFCDFEENKPEVKRKILIKKFKLISIKNKEKYPVKIKITDWEYFEK